MVCRSGEEPVDFSLVWILINVAIIIIIIIITVIIIIIIIYYYYYYVAWWIECEQT